ncbi:MAG: peptide chain release factor 1 [Chitinivibrionales bacterium]|nr:peptide chain release factor 1 [Chitinivibrionales bacterium]
MIEKIKSVLARYKELEDAMSQPGVAGDSNLMGKLGREYAAIGKSLPALNRFLDVSKRLADARLLVKTESDPDLMALAKEEIETLEPGFAQFEDQVRLLLVPKDPNDFKNAIVEIRAGTGGTEAAIFAADLYRMYTHYIENSGWKHEIMSSSYAELGGIKEIVFIVNGQNAYGQFKYESGVHRVQRVPLTEAQGRVHTSAASVAVFPEADELEVQIKPEELRIDVFRAGGAGGQHVNKTESAVRIVHLPTGITVSCQDEKSQIKNRAKGMKVLQSRVYDAMLRQEQEAKSASRKTMVGSGDRSAKIRTYNFPQNRVTDHRIGLTLYKLDAVVNGDLQALIDALAMADTNEKLGVPLPPLAVEDDE